MTGKNIYILKLDNKKWYIGTSNDVEKRIKKHIQGDGSKWTAKYAPVKLVKSYKIKDLYEEDKITIKYMDKYGIDNVRGGSFCKMNLTEAEKNVLRKMITTQNNKCFSCGKSGHYAKECNVLYIDNSDESDTKCYRCKRYGHYKHQCYAKTDINGKYLNM